MQQSLFNPIRANLSPNAQTYLATLGIIDIDSHPERAAPLFYHSLAILHSPLYRCENATALRSDFPRIPLPKTRTLLEKSAEIGEIFSALMDTETEIPGVTTGGIFPRYAVVAKFHTTDGDLKLTAGWGRESNGTVMPGRGKLKVSGEAAGVFLNNSSFWSAIPISAWEYKMGGYQVLKKWLSYREYAVLGRTLADSETLAFTNIARRITAMLHLESALDTNYQTVKSAATRKPI